ncbi:5'-nucleotidase [Zobellella denitrificans]
MWLTEPAQQAEASQLERRLSGPIILWLNLQQSVLPPWDYQRILRTAIVTARNAPAHERVITTLEKWGVSSNETFFLGGMKKERILTVLKPHMFFDDQKSHLESEAGDIPMVHVPFGIANQRVEQKSSANL